MHTTMTVHGVAAFEVDETDGLSMGCYVRHITITSYDGSKLRITLFSDTLAALALPTEDEL